MESSAEILVSPANQKKLKQTRLPFQILSPSTPKTAPTTDLPSKKRRLSTGGDSDVAPAAKVVKVVVEKTKENQHNDLSAAGDETTTDDKIIDLVDDEENPLNDSGKELIMIKMPFGSNKKKAKKTKKSAKKSPPPPEALTGQVPEPTIELLSEDECQPQNIEKSQVGKGFALKLRSF